MREQHGSAPKKVHRRCCSIQGFHIGSRQKYVIMVERMDQRNYFLLRIRLITKILCIGKIENAKNSLSCGFYVFLPPDCASDLCCDDGICYTDLRWRCHESDRSVNCCSGIEYYSMHHLAFLSVLSIVNCKKFSSWLKFHYITML